MVFPILAAIPAIFKGIEMFNGMFDDGVEIIEKITGSPSKAKTPEALRMEYEELPPALKEQWAEQMSAKLEMYKAESARLSNEQGSVDAETLNAMDPKTAGKVAWLRMTTRPWCVRWAVRTLIFPIWAVFLVDIPLIIHNSISATYGGGRSIDLLAQTILSSDSGFVTVYSWFAPSAVSITMTYMTLRQVGKNKGQADGDPSVAGLVGRVKGLYEKIVK